MDMYCYNFKQTREYMGTIQKLNTNVDFVIFLGGKEGVGGTGEMGGGGGG